MQFRDLKKQYQVLKEEMDVAISEVLENCNFISGNQVKELEERLAKYVGRKHCITCGNGTDALTMMMMAWNIKEGDAVFVLPAAQIFHLAPAVADAGPVRTEARAGHHRVHHGQPHAGHGQTVADAVLSQALLLHRHQLPHRLHEARGRAGRDGLQGRGLHHRQGRVRPAHDPARKERRRHNHRQAAALRRRSRWKTSISSPRSFPTNRAYSPA